MIQKVFSDYFAQKDNFLSKIDARVKMVFIPLLILITISSNQVIVPIMAAVVSLWFLLIIKIPSKIIALRLIFPLIIAFVIVVMQFFFYGTTPLIDFNFFGWHFIGYEEGFLRGILIMSKVIGSVSLIIFLSMTTSINKLFNAARWFKVPQICVEIALLTFRYIFVLLDDALMIRDAQRVRLGYSSFLKGMQSIGTLAGTVVIQSYDQSIAIYESMLLRGYSGEMVNLSSDDRFSMRDGIASGFFVFTAVSFIILNKGL